MRSQRGPRASGAVAARRRLAVFAGLKLLGVAVLDFVLLRLVAPDLVNLHRDWALVGSLFSVLLAVGAAVWLVIQLWSDRLRWIRLDPHLISRVRETET